MERIGTRTKSFSATGMIATLLCLMLWPGTVFGQTFGRVTSTTAWMGTATTPTTTSSTVTRTSTIQAQVIEPEPAASETNETTTTTTSFGGAGLDPMITLEPGTSVAHDPHLVVTGGSPDDPLIVDAQPKTFADWDALFQHLEAELGATLIRDAAGTVMAARGRYVQNGSVVFDDQGNEFESLDYVAAYLGGLEGVVQVGSATLELGTSAGTEVSYLLQTDQVCDDWTGSCIEGHSWVTHFLFYHSAGARTKQISGAMEDVVVYFCTAGTLVTVGGGRQCRIRNTTQWEFDPEIREWIPLPLEDGEDFYYVPASYRIEEVLRNQLTVSARLIYGPQASVPVPPVTEFNTDEVEMGDWTIVRDILPDDFENPIPLADISGICGFHSSSAGGFVATSDGATGDDDVLCTGPGGF